MKNIILNSAVNAALPDTTVTVGTPFAIQLAPAGEYPQYIDDPDAPGEKKEVMQILDAQAMETLVRNFEACVAEAEKNGKRYAVLVDADHSSETPGANGEMDTRASAWVTRLYIDPEKGLMAEINPTSKGADEINGKVYRFVSGAWTLDDAGRPEKLVSVGLTNKPNLPVAPMINAQVAKEQPGTAPNASVGVTANEPGATTNAGDNNAQDETTPSGDNINSESTVTADNADVEVTDQKEIINMDIKQKLGLPEEATDAEIESAIDALIAKCEGMNGVREALSVEDDTVTDAEVVNAVTELVNTCRALNEEQVAAEQAKLNAEAEQFVSDNADVIPEDQVEAIQNEYVENADAAKDTVANFRKVYERAVINAHREMSAKAEVAKTHVIVSNAEARKPAAINAKADFLSSNDPIAMNAAIAKMAKIG